MGKMIGNPSVSGDAIVDCVSLHMSTCRSGSSLGDLVTKQGWRSKQIACIIANHLYLIHPIRTPNTV
jgi:hypothetical protein